MGEIVRKRITGEDFLEFRKQFHRKRMHFFRRHCICKLVLQYFYESTVFGEMKPLQESLHRQFLCSIHRTAFPTGLLESIGSLLVTQGDEIRINGFVRVIFFKILPQVQSVVGQYRRLIVMFHFTRILWIYC